MLLHYLKFEDYFSDYILFFSLRCLLHSTPSEHNKQIAQLQALEQEELVASEAFIERLLEESLSKLEEEEKEGDHFVRWELGACWIQHLQDQKNADKDKKPSAEKAKHEMKVEGLGTPLRSLKNNKKKSEGNNLKMLSKNSNAHVDGAFREAGNTFAPGESEVESNAKDNELVLKALLPDAAFSRLKESETGLHCKVILYDPKALLFSCI